MKLTKLAMTLGVVFGGIWGAPFFALGHAWAEREEPAAEVRVSAMSQYIWRGQELSKDSMVVQPSVTVGYQGFGLNIWGNIDPGSMPGETTNWNETDLTLSCNAAWGAISVTGGYIYYALDGIPDSQEFFMSISLDTILSPTITLYREFAHYLSWYLTAQVSHSFRFPHDITLQVAALASYLAAEDESDYPEIDSHGNLTGHGFHNLHDGVISAALNIPVAKHITVTPQAYWVFPLSDDASNEMKWRSFDGDDDTFFYGGVAVSFSF